MQIEFQFTNIRVGWDAILQTIFALERRIIMASARQHRIRIFDISLPVTATLPHKPAQHRRWLGNAAALAIVFALTVAATQAAQAQTFQSIHTFTGGADEGFPGAGLTMDNAGNLYGTTGGVANFGTVFRLRRSDSGWILSTLHSFTGGNDGEFPDAAVTLAQDGSLYGTTIEGGPQNCGTVFNLTPPATGAVPSSVLSPWNKNTPHVFTGPPNDGCLAYSNVIFDRTGNLFGTTYFGGTHDVGAVYELMRSGSTWTANVLYNFTWGDDGGAPYAGLVFDGSGNLYGTASGSGINAGSVFELTPSGSGWTYHSLHIFQSGGTDGMNPYAGLVFDRSGNIYGATVYGGQYGGGTVFELSPSGGSWTYTLLYSLQGAVGPLSSLTLDADGNLYGTRQGNGSSDDGSVFELTPSQGGWVFTDLHDFTGGADGATPEGSVIVDATGNLYGTASSGGTYGYGVVFEITP